MVKPADQLTPEQQRAYVAGYTAGRDGLEPDPPANRLEAALYEQGVTDGKAGERPLVPVPKPASSSAKKPASSSAKKKPAPRTRHRGAGRRPAARAGRATSAALRTATAPATGAARSAFQLFAYGAGLALALNLARNSDAVAGVVNGLAGAVRWLNDPHHSIPYHGGK